MRGQETTKKTEKQKVRLDKYLWCIRIFKTRSQATEAIDKGVLKLKENQLKRHALW